MRAWAIKHWNETFENAASRKLRHLDYFPFLTDRGSLRFKQLLHTPEGGLAYGHFAAIVQYSATLPCRGLLVRSGRPLTVALLGLELGVPEAVLAPSWAVLVSPDIGWIEETDFDPAAPLPFVWNQSQTKSATDPPRPRHEPASNLPTKAGRQTPCLEIPQSGIARIGPACLPGKDLRSVLAGFGVEDPALTLIVGSGKITPDEACEAWNQIQEAVGRPKNPVREPARAFTAALCKRAGVTLRTAGHLGVNVMKQVNDLNAMRERNRAAQAR